MSRQLLSLQARLCIFADTCQYKPRSFQSADVLHQQKVSLYNLWHQNYPHISDRAQKAKEWGIDIDHPEKLSNKTSYCYQIFNSNPNVNQGSIIFNTTKNQPFSTVNFGSKGTYKIANVISVVNNQFQELPIIPAKLLRAYQLIN